MGQKYPVKKNMHFGLNSPKLSLSYIRWFLFLRRVRLDQFGDSSNKGEVNKMGTNRSCVIIAEWVFQGQPKTVSTVCFDFDRVKAID